MKAAILHDPGPAENLQLVDLPIPEPIDGKVLVKVRAFGLNRSELMTRKGLSPSVNFPRILGIECVGEVEFDPSGEYPKGQQVMAFMGEMGRNYDGSYAEYTMLPKEVIYPFTSSLPWEILGAIPEMYQTVHGSLFLALGIQRGETLLIRGGTSSVGLLAAQVANNLGLTVLATTRSQKKLEKLLQNGAAHALLDDGNLQEQVRRLYPDRIDKVLELVGTVTLKDSLHCVKPGGAVCMTGMLSESWSIPDFAPMEFIPAAVNLTVYDSGQLRSPASVFQDFIDAVASGRIYLRIGRVFPLDQIVEAHQLMESNRADGKIVVLNSDVP